MGILSGISPYSVFYFFEEISNIPRGSGNEKAVSDYILSFAKSKGLECVQDEANNILIKKDGTKGYEGSKTLIIQGHMDMVCEKNNGVNHDFLMEGLKLKVTDDFIFADGTTLGADNGIAVAYALAVLSSDEIEHPPLEILLTTDEEVGMNGAASFDASILKGKMLLNMDTEEEGKLLVSSCGGMKVTISLKALRIEAENDRESFLLKISGLKGGHSGADIHLQRANANKLLGRILFALNEVYDIDIASLNGGNMDNAITRESEAAVLVKKCDVDKVNKLVKDYEEIFKHEYISCDENISVNFMKLNEKVHKVFTKDVSNKAVSILNLIPNGVLSKSLTIDNLVETSNNIGVLKTDGDLIKFTSAVRSSVKSKKYDVYNQLKIIAAITGSEISFRGDYPSWEYNPDSYLLKVFKKTYEDMYEREPEIEAIHAGLECGLFAEKVEGLDMISIGPNMYDVHTPNERLSISSTQRVWEYLIEILKKLK